MGTYTELTVAGLGVLSSQSYVDSEAMTIFREGDRQFYQVRSEDDDPEDEVFRTVIEYRCTKEIAIDRLEVMGFTLQRARGAYEQGRLSKIEEYESWSDDGDPTGDLFEEPWRLLKGFSFDSYIEALRTAIDERVTWWCAEEHPNPAVRYIFDAGHEFWCGYLGKDLRLLIRTACECAPAGSFVIQDVSELVAEGYYSEDEPICSNAIKALTADHAENSPIIVLTEGAGDTRVLSRALRILYPHLSEYYSFLDFGESRKPGGAGYLVSNVKAFAGAGILNRIIALFDNDSAARDARRSLAPVPLPANIAVLSYPEIDFLNEYPTKGPSGLSCQNVNGLAGSIELYLGRDVLQCSGSLIPVQWKGYIEGIAAYQGEVLEKDQIHSRFDLKAARCEANPELLQSSDWSGLTSILRCMFKVFACETSDGTDQAGLNSGH